MIFKTIKRNNHYEISDTGVVRSKDRTTINKKGVQKTYKGKVLTIANIGEQLPNSDSKVFEVMIRVEGSDPALRPSMTTTNKVIIKTFNDVIHIPTECVHAGSDRIPYVYTKNGVKYRRACRFAPRKKGPPA